MTRRVVLTAIAALVIVSGFLWALSALTELQGRASSVIGFAEEIALLAPAGERQVSAQIDTGADSSSIDRSLAVSLGYEIDGRRTKTVRTQAGVEERDVVDISFRLAGREVDSEATVTDRSLLPAQLIVGRADLPGFLVDPASSFLGGRSDGLAAANVVGFRERVLLLSPSGDIEIPALLDTGSGLSSIDEAFASSIGFQPDVGRLRTVVTSQGSIERPTIELGFILGQKEIRSISTVADRSGMVNRMLVGREDMGGFLVDPSREFVASGDSSRSLLSGIPFLRLQSSGLAKIIIIIPMLGAVVVVLKLLAGLRTFGIFGPVVVGLSLLSLGILPGIAIYVLLLTVGIAIKIMVLDRLNVAHMAEFSLIMFVMVLVLVAAVTLPLGLDFSFGDVFFPLIITSHLIEQAARSMEEHSLRDFAPVMVLTLAAALALAYYASFLIEQPLPVLWGAFILSMLIVIVSGFYSGLRLSELVRFKFLKKTHTHE